MRNDSSPPRRERKQWTKARVLNTEVLKRRSSGLSPVLTGDFPASGGEHEALLDFRGRSGGGLKVGGLDGGGNGLTGTEGHYRWSRKVRRRERLIWGETSSRSGGEEQREGDLNEEGE